ncbi:hypothetical protein AVEN_123172-1 [Araneus ventricosus]|uniref:HAT C-terminal dimerisation domain-containing protein n=1 Tax=Araneus ventricosus TaxID=182803 RepID=A0A4Y2JRD1_ARAVE|nr:hypothetical protein AVEN_123172-1 [Araneus ventricosus]
MQIFKRNKRANMMSLYDTWHRQLLDSIKDVHADNEQNTWKGHPNLQNCQSFLCLTLPNLRLVYSSQFPEKLIRNSVKEEFDGFYVRCIAYLDLWENSFGKTEQFAWVNLTKTNAVDWENAETSAEIINSSLLYVPDMKINNDELFDEVVLAKEYLQSNWEQWKQEETTRDVIISSEEKWLRLFGHFKENHIAVPNLIKILEYAFCLPRTSPPVERVFSLMNNA